MESSLFVLSQGDYIAKLMYSLDLHSFLTMKTFSYIVRQFQLLDKSYTVCI